MAELTPVQAFLADTVTYVLGLIIVAVIAWWAWWSWSVHDSRKRGRRQLGAFQQDQDKQSTLRTKTGSD